MGDRELCPEWGMGSCVLGGYGNGELDGGWGSCVLGGGALSAGSKASLAVPLEPRVFVFEEGRLSDERLVTVIEAALCLPK